MLSFLLPFQLVGFHLVCIHNFILLRKLTTYITIHRRFYFASITQHLVFLFFFYYQISFKFFCPYSAFIWWNSNSLALCDWCSQHPNHLLYYIFLSHNLFS